MPKLSEVRVEALRELVDQLRFSSSAAAAKHVERAESLAGELDPEQAYPLEWVLFRLTEYRSDDLSGLVTGDALLRDLSALVERLCSHAELTLADVPDALSLDALCERWNVSAKSIERYRRKGLIARRVIEPESTQVRVVFTRASVERFEAANAALLSRAGGFSRIATADQERMIKRANRYQRTLGFSRARAIRRLSERTGRSQEALRQLLAREQPEPRTTRDADLFEAWRRGESVGDIADRFGIAASTAHTRINTWRSNKLSGLRLGESSLPQGEAIESLIDSDAVRSGLDTGGPSTLAELLELMRTRAVPVGAHERLLGRAIVALRSRASSLIGRSMSAAQIDRAETDLLWASRLKATLGRPMLWVVGSQIRDVLGADTADRLSTDDWQSLLGAVMPAMASGLGRWDPWSQGRPAGAVTVAVSRAAARWLTAHPGTLRTHGATRLIEPDAPIDDWTRSLDAWQAWLEPPRLDWSALSTSDRQLIESRYGVSGERPLTSAELATQNGSSAIGIERRTRRAVHAALIGLDDNKPLD